MFKTDVSTVGIYVWNARDQIEQRIIDVYFCQKYPQHNQTVRADEPSRTAKGLTAT